VLRLGDSDIRPAHRGEFRVLVAARRTGLGQVRAYLTADILRRLSERSGLAPTVVDLRPDQEDELRAVCGELNIHPPRHTLTGNDQLGGLFADSIRQPVFDVGVRAEPAEPAVAGLARHWIEVAGSADGAGGEAGRPLRERLGLGEEPLSVRMTLMRHGYGEPPGDGGDPRGAAKTLAQWRELVAVWARSPSGPMSRRYADAIAGAFADGLDTAAALRELDALAGDPGEPDGVKFETFAAADLLFGLDLARDVGR
jgi:hypothetical protein